MAITDIRGAQVDASDPPISTSPNPGLAIKAPVLVATTGSDIALSGVQVIDGVTVGNNAERVLVKDQTDQTTNGIYNAATGPWTRAVDASNNSQFATGTLVLVTAGATNAGETFRLTSLSPIVLGTTVLVFISQIGVSLPISVADGGTGALSASGAALDNITGFNATGFLQRTGAGAYAFVANPLPVANGGTGGTTQAAGQISLGVRERLTANRTYYVRTVPVTVTISIANPGVVTWANHGLTANAPVVFNTSGALPTGFATGVIYYVVGTSITTNTFEVSTAPNGTAINTSGSQSGTQTAQTGNDSNNGLSQTPTGAFLTCQHLVSAINQLIDLNGYSVFGQLAHGYYLENVVLAPYTGRGGTGHTSPTIQGDAANPGATVIQAASGAAISATEAGGFEWVLQNINVSSPAGTGIDVDVGAWVVCNGVFYSACVNHNIVSGGTLEFTGPCTIAASASSCFIQMSNQGKLLDTGNAHTVSNTPNFGFAFIYLTDGSLAAFPSSTGFTGAATGARWSIDESSFCDSQGVSFDTLFPGNVNGSYAPIEVRRGGTADTGTAWTAYSPVVTAGSGTITTATASGRYKLLGKTAFVQLTVSITTNGSGASNIQLSLPFTAGAARYAVTGLEYAATGKQVVGASTAGGSEVVIYFYDGSYPGNSGYALALSGVMETA
jgi:hypothetical protein